jgi:hypothetical protein
MGAGNHDYFTVIIPKPMFNTLIDDCSYSFTTVYTILLLCLVAWVYVCVILLTEDISQIQIHKSYEQEGHHYNY